MFQSERASSAYVVWPDEPIASLSQLQGPRALSFFAKIAALGINAQRIVLQEDPARGVFAWVTTPHEQRLRHGAPSSPLLEPLQRALAASAHVDLLVAFVSHSGVQTLAQPLYDALVGGACVRIITGDYLQITSPQALRALLDLGELLGLSGGDGVPMLEVRVVETAQLDATTFHPKSWIFRQRDGQGSLFVGSSNLSRAALIDGVEWNMHLSRQEDWLGFDRVVAQYERLWEKAQPVTHAWIDAYERTRPPSSFDASHHKSNDAGQIPEPRAAQLEALALLHAHRAAGHKRALVVMATGLGKTWLAAFDVRQLELTRSKTLKVLFIAHRAELLWQARQTFDVLFPSRTKGLIQGTTQELDAELVFASVMTLQREERLLALDPSCFDYIIIDEVHHATSTSYQRVLAHFDAEFVLGLTATPERGDGEHISSLFDHQIVYEATLADGIRQGALVPFRYLGLPDVIDYKNLPWRGQGFDPEAFAVAAQTQARMARLMEAWTRYEATRTLVFCCTVAHARWVAAWLGARGVRVTQLDGTSATLERVDAVRALKAGELDAICVVDLFNEGVDIPQVDRVVMLRPTQSPVIFLQQLGRGLRRAEGYEKQALTVIDFVGNHSSFLTKMQTLLNATTSRLMSLRRFVRAPEQVELPPGCSIHLDVQVIESLDALLPEALLPTLIQAYERLTQRHGERPSAALMYAEGHHPQGARSVGGWFFFVNEMGDLSEAQGRVLLRMQGWFERLEGRALSAQALMLIQLWAQEVAQAHQSSQPLEVLARTLGLSAPQLDAVVSELTQGAAAFGWLGVYQGQLQWQRPMAVEDLAPWSALSLELLEYLLLRRQQLDRQGHLEQTAAHFVAQVQDDLSLRLPTRDQRGLIPRGELVARGPDGRLWVFTFGEKTCVKVRALDRAGERLDDLLAAWFGHQTLKASGLERLMISFERRDDQWSVRPHEASLGLSPGQSLTEDELEALTQGGYTLHLIETPGQLLTPETLRPMGVLGARPLAVLKDGERWRFHSAVSLDDTGQWRIASVELATWRRFGASPEEISRPLGAQQRAYAQAFVARLDLELLKEMWLDVDGVKLRIIGKSAQGGLKLALESGKTRSISQTDLAWALYTYEQTQELSGLSVERVNQRRYLAGTPKASTRYIDTGWAIRIIKALEHL